MFVNFLIQLTLITSFSHTWTQSIDPFYNHYKSQFPVTFNGNNNFQFIQKQVPYNFSKYFNLN